MCVCMCVRARVRVCVFAVVHVCYAWAELGAALQAVAAAGMHATHIPEGGEQEV